jgi:hypothetical protein
MPRSLASGHPRPARLRAQPRRCSIGSSPLGQSARAQLAPRPASEQEADASPQRDGEHQRRVVARPAGLEDRRGNLLTVDGGGNLRGGAVGCPHRVLRGDRFLGRDRRVGDVAPGVSCASGRVGDGRVPSGLAAFVGRVTPRRGTLGVGRPARSGLWRKLRHGDLWLRRVAGRTLARRTGLDAVVPGLFGLGFLGLRLLGLGFGWLGLLGLGFGWLGLVDLGFGWLGLLGLRFLRLGFLGRLTRLGLLGFRLWRLGLLGLGFLRLGVLGLRLPGTARLARLGLGLASLRLDLGRVVDRVRGRRRRLRERRPCDDRTDGQRDRKDREDARESDQSPDAPYLTGCARRTRACARANSSEGARRLLVAQVLRPGSTTPWTQT